MHCLDDLLTGRETLAEGLATQPFAHRLEERAHHAEFDVGLEQGRTNFAESFVEVGVAQSSARNAVNPRCVRIVR